MRFLSSRVLVSTVVGVVGVAGLTAGVNLARQRSTAGMVTAANNFLTSLTPEQRQKAVYPIATAACLDASLKSNTAECEWTKWHFIPASMAPRNGLPIKEMTEAQRQRAYDLMRAGLSQRGYQTATAIMQLEPILKELEANGYGAAPAGAAGGRAATGGAQAPGGQAPAPAAPAPAAQAPQPAPGQPAAAAGDPQAGG